MKKLIVILIAYTLFLTPAFAQRWDTLGGGLPFGSTIFGLNIYNGQLIAGGDFDSAGGQPANNIAQWNGSVWSALGLGITGPYPIAEPPTEYNGDLIVVGSFNSPANGIAEWNGSAWANPFGGLYFVSYAGAIAAIVHNGKLVVGGGFSSAGGIPVNNIAQWNGTQWDSLGSGVLGIVPSYSYRSILALDTFQGNLIAGGEFDTAGGQPAERIAEWNGTSWSPLSSGCTGSGLLYPSMVEALTVYNGELIVGGYFDTVGGIPANKIAAWNGTSWSNPFGSGTVGDNGGVMALAVYKGKLIVSGEFDSIDGVTAHSIAEWDGSNWYALGKGITWGGGMGLDAL